MELELHIIDHPNYFKTGTRVLLLKGRRKDGLEDQRMIAKVTHDETEFNQVLKSLALLAVPGERIYGTAGDRCMFKAIREFKRRQLDADYDADATGLISEPPLQRLT